MEFVLKEPEEASDRMISSFELPEKIDRYLQEADEIQRSMESATTPHDRGEANRLLKTVMARFEDLFRYILVAYDSSNFSDTESLGCSSFSSSPSNFRFSSSETYTNCTPNVREGSDAMSYNGSRLSCSGIYIPEIEIALLPPEAVYYLQCIAQRMIASGYTQECIQAYTSIRKPALDARFRMLGIEKMSTRDIQMLEWDSLEKKIRHWIRAAAVCIWDLFVSEKKLSEQIFEGLSSLSTGIECACFAATVDGPATQFLGFAEAVVSSSHRSPERMFCMLKLHDALSDLLPDIEFEPRSLASIRVQAAEILLKLAEVIRGILLELEKAVLHEISKGQIPGGAVHPLARYVMNYVVMLYYFKRTLTELIVSKPALVLESNISGDLRKDIEELELEEGNAPFALHLHCITTVLQFKLEEKSKQYEDASLAHLFMMNNLYYMVHKIDSVPKMREMIADGHFRKLTEKFRLAAADYQRSTWVKVLNCLRGEELFSSGSFSNGISKKALRERLKTFNAMFEKVCKTQATWLVPNVQLREELRISISQKVIPAYRAFLRRYGHLFSNRSYIKYTPEDLENAVLDFFKEQSS